MTVDLDSARAARREASGVTPVVVFHGQSYELPVELPFAVLEALSEVDTATKTDDTAEIAAGTRRALQPLLGEGFQAFMDARPSQEDIMALLGGVMQEYAAPPLGEALASGA